MGNWPKFAVCFSYATSEETPWPAVVEAEHGSAGCYLRSESAGWLVVSSVVEGFLKTE